MNKFTIEIEGGEVVGGELRAPVINLIYNGKKLGAIQGVHFSITSHETLPTLRLIGLSNEILQCWSSQTELEDLKKAWPWAGVSIVGPLSGEVKELT